MRNFKVWDKVVKDIRWYEKNKWCHLDFEIANTVSISWEEINYINWNPVEMYRKATKEEIKLYFK